MGPVRTSRHPAQLFPVLSIYSHCPFPFHPSISCITRPHATGSHQRHQPGARRPPRPSPSIAAWGTLCCSKSPKGVGWDKMAMMKFFRRPPNSGTSAQLHCQWLQYCRRHLFKPDNASGAAFPTAPSRFDTSADTLAPSLLEGTASCTRAPGPGAGTLSSP